MYTKAQIFNLACSALLLTREITDPDTDPSNEARVLRIHWPVALSYVLADLDLDATMSKLDLELIEENPNSLWLYAYRRPAAAVFVRRLVSCYTTDNRSTRHKIATGVHNGENAIFANNEDAMVEFISKDAPLTALNAAAGMALATYLARISSPLITGKGAGDLKKSLKDEYALYKTAAQAHDRMENFNYDDPETASEFVEARTGRG